MSLTICLLTRDAETKIERALRSVADLEAEVIVADTGSTDATVNVARSLGAKVLALRWQDDFGAAQNHTIGEATRDWIFWLNPDEELLPRSLERLPTMLARTDVLAYGVRVQEVMNPQQPDKASETLYLRLFRRHPEVRFIGRLHPHFEVPLEELARRESKSLEQSNLLLRHHAYLSVLTPDKLRWATRLLELELKDRPGQLHYLIEYARNLLLLNDPTGHAVMAAAADQVLAAREAPVAPSPSVASLFEYILTVSPQQSRSHLSPQEAGRLALRWFPNSPPLLWALAQRAFQARECRSAAKLLEILVDLGRTGAYDRSAAFDPSIMAEPAILNLGNCYLRLGELDRAQSYFEQLLNSPTHQAQAWEGFAAVREQRRGT